MIADLATRLAAHGLILRGGFHPALDDAVPHLADGRRAETILLVGNAGPAMWDSFTASPESRLAVDSLDSWTRRVVASIAPAIGAEAWFPFDGPPHLPFQRWGSRSEDVHVSPLRLLIHPEYGLWHAYRAALAFADRLTVPPRGNRPSPCAGCATRPCLAACPVAAHDVNGFAVERCIGHLLDGGGAACREAGCLSRLACPVGPEFRQDAAQSRFHMRAFTNAAGSKRQDQAVRAS